MDKAFGNARLKAEVAVQKQKGRAQEALGKAKGVVEDFVDKA